MKQKLLLTLIFCLMAGWSVAQTPKWVDKSKSAVFSIITYDQNGNMLNTGNGFFITESGVGLSDYDIFKGAQRAVVVDPQGNQMPVSMILGANEMYNVVKFSVTVTGKKVSALSLAPAAPVVNSTVFVLPYSTQKDKSFTSGKVQKADKMEGQYNYYTLNLSLRDKLVSCPVVNGDGAVFALAQKSSGADSTLCYGVDVNFANSLQINALSFNDNSLTKIGIKKALPETEEDALAMIYMVSSTLSLPDYMSLLNEFLAKFPNSADGYLRRANVQLAMSQDNQSLRQVEADMDAALKVTSDKASAYYDKANLIYSYLGTNPESPYNNWTYDTALAELDKAIKENPLPIYSQLQGDIRFAKGDYAGAYQSYDVVNHSSLVSAATFYNAAKTKELLEDTDVSLALMDSCISKFPRPYTVDAAPYLLERARMRDAAEKPRQALADYDEYYNAVNTQVNDVFYYLRAQCAMRARAYQRALDDYVEAVEINPQELTYRAELALANMRVGRNEEALQVLADAEKVDPTYSEIYRLRGLAQLQLKKNTEACENFKKAKELGNEEAQALIDKYCN